MKAYKLITIFTLLISALVLDPGIVSASQQTGQQPVSANPAYSEIPEIYEHHGLRGEHAVQNRSLGWSHLFSADNGTHSFGNPAGCSSYRPNGMSARQMLDNVQLQIGGGIDLASRMRFYTWNGSKNSFVDITVDPYAIEIEVNEYQYPFIYQADLLATALVQNGFVVWFRMYSGELRILAVALLLGVEESIWGDYYQAYWKNDGPPDDRFIVPVSKKLPCHWLVEEGYVSDQDLIEVFPLKWQVPDYLEAGRKYLAETCRDAYKVSQDQIGYWDATSMCGPLTWQIIHDVDSFPYRIGSYNDQPDLFIGANPRYWGARPWVGFDPETYDLVVRTQEQMAGYDFKTRGNLYTGDILFSYGSPDQWALGGGNFSHIFMVAGVDENNSRLAVTNLVKNKGGVKDCFIKEVVLYTPGDLVQGMINYEWNDHGYGMTGKFGFDVFRWKWITYHNSGQSQEYTVRWGETIETIAFDWKVAPEQILTENRLDAGQQLTPGWILSLPPIMENDNYEVAYVE